MFVHGKHSSTHSYRNQALNITALSASMSGMNDEVEKFAVRLNEALDDIGVPPKGKGRQVVVAGMFGVSQKGARKWLEAEGMPDTKRIPEMARKLGVMSEWLLSGRLPKKPETTATPEELLLASLRAAGWQADYCTGRPPLKANVAGQEVAYRPDIRAERGGDVLYFDIKDINLLADPLHRALASQRPELIQLPTESAANAAFFAEQRLRDMRRIQEEPAVYMPQGAIPMPAHLKAVPVVGSAQLGDNGYWAEMDYPVGHGDGYIDFPTRDPNAYALRCKGDSMAPRIKDGEFVVIEPNAAPHPGDEVMVKSEDGRVMVKELLYVRDGIVHLASVNESHGRISIPLNQVAAMHLVVGIVKRTRWRPD